MTKQSTKSKEEQRIDEICSKPFTAESLIEGIMLKQKIHEREGWK